MQNLQNGIRFLLPEAYSFIFYLFFVVLFIYFTLFYFTILYWFCHTSTWIHHRCTWVPNPEPPSHFPPYTISLGHPSAPAPSILYPALILEWWFVSYMILYMFQCQSRKCMQKFQKQMIPKSLQWQVKDQYLLSSVLSLQNNL